MTVELVVTHRDASQMRIEFPGVDSKDNFVTVVTHNEGDEEDAYVEMDFDAALGTFREACRRIEFLMHARECEL